MTNLEDNTGGAAWPAQTRRLLRLYGERLSRSYGEKHPFTLLAKSALDSCHHANMEEVLDSFRSCAELDAQVCGPQKEDLLKKYAERHPTPFRQFDGFYLPRGGDDVMRADKEGHCLMGGETWELMDGADIRVLVSEDTVREQVPQLMHKLARWIVEEYSKPEAIQGADIPF